jgi:leader peptidase (prepilin peptidase)/N-methyltransferase
MPLFLNLPVFSILAAALGLVLGSFYSVCVTRYLDGGSIVYPPSHCPLCNRRLRAWELLPVVSYLFLRGRCAGCGNRISVLYPLIELTSAAWAVLAAQATGPSLWFLAYLALGGLFIVASAIDFKAYLLPDILTYPAAVLGLAMGALRPDIGPLGAAIGAACGFGLFWLLAPLSRQGPRPHHAHPLRAFFVLRRIGPTPVWPVFSAPACQPLTIRLHLSGASSHWRQASIFYNRSI